MTLLNRVSDTFWSYVSPRKTQHRRDKDFKATVPPVTPHMPKKTGLRAMLQSPELTPDARIDNWDVHTPHRGPGSVDGADLPPSPPTSVGRSYTDAAGDTVIDSMTENLNVNSQEEWDANEETMVVDEAQYLEEQEQKRRNAELERERRENQGRDLRAAGWSEDGVFLFQKLGMRGFEPLLPIAWIQDFGTFPRDLFTQNIDKAFIKPAHGSMGHGQLALEKLLGIGGRVRDAVTNKAPKRTAEWQIIKHVLDYNKWAVRDGNIRETWKDISLFDTVKIPHDQRANVAERKMLQKLGEKAELWKEGLQERQQQALDSGASTLDLDLPGVPTLYGVISCHTIMAFVSYDATSSKPLLRTVAMFDLGQEGFDVWNSLAIAIFVVHCRNRMIELQECLPPPEEKEPPSDPDA